MNRESFLKEKTGETHRQHDVCKIKKSPTGTGPTKPARHAELFRGSELKISGDKKEVTDYDDLIIIGLGGNERPPTIGEGNLEAMRGEGTLPYVWGGENKRRERGNKGGGTA